MKIKILGTGCAKCRSLEKLAREVVSTEGFDAEIIKVEDIQDIMKYHIMVTPALVVDEKVELKGYVPSVSELKKILSKYSTTDQSAS